MDLEAPLKPEVLRPLITLIVPGTIAVGPFVLVTGHYVAAVQAFWTEHPSAFTVLLALTVLAVGFMIDDFATNIEAWLWDPLLSRRSKHHMEDWNRYLKLQLSDELVGHRYLRTKLTQLKFELAMPPALVIFAVGVLWLNAIFGFWSWLAMAGIETAIVALAVYLLCESLQTAALLSKTRRRILEAIDEGVHGIHPRRSVV